MVTLISPSCMDSKMGIPLLTDSKTREFCVFLAAWASRLPKWSAHIGGLDYHGMAFLWEILHSVLSGKLFWVLADSSGFLLQWWEVKSRPVCNLCCATRVDASCVMAATTGLHGKAEWLLAAQSWLFPCKIENERKYSTCRWWLKSL